MQYFQAGFELKNFEVGKIVAIGINMRIFLMFERENRYMTNYYKLRDHSLFMTGGGLAKFN